MNTRATNIANKPRVLNVSVQSPSMSANDDKSPSENKTVDKVTIEKKLDGICKLFLNKLNELEDRLLKRMNSISAEFAAVREEVSTAINRVCVLEDRCASIGSDLADLRARVNAVENNVIATDCILYNVPTEVDATVVVDSVLKKLSCNSLMVNEVIRVRSKNNSNHKCSPIICKFRTAHDRIKLFKALALFRKNVKRQLCASDIHLEGDFSISIYECLTPTSRKIMSAAIQHKNNKILTSVFSLRGQVFVRVKTTDKAIKINDMSDLLKAVGANAAAN